MELNKAELQKTLDQLLASAKGILAADESEGNINQKFKPLTIDNHGDNRRLYREILFTTPGIEKWISGVILHEETFGQSIKGESIPQFLQHHGIVPGIKVDQGLEDAPNGEKTTRGLDKLADRMHDYFHKGARFAKWRAVYKITDSTPSVSIIKDNAEGLASYAKICLENGIVPIVEPEVLAEGEHTAEHCMAVTDKVLKAVFQALQDQHVPIEYIILKPNMIVPGLQCATTLSPEKVAEHTLSCLKATVPSKVPGIFFLSGGQTEDQATLHLNYMAADTQLPWRLSFSYGRALQDSAVKAWGGQETSIIHAQQAFLKRAEANGLASMGQYKQS